MTALVLTLTLSFTQAAARADRDFWQRVLQIRPAQLRVSCHGQRPRAVCRDAARAVWIEGHPPAWAHWTDSVVLRGRRLVIHTWPDATIE
jgi:hypothetical protein